MPIIGKMPFEPPPAPEAEPEQNQLRGIIEQLQRQALNEVDPNLLMLMKQIRARDELAKAAVEQRSTKG